MKKNFFYAAPIIFVIIYLAFSLHIKQSLDNAEFSLSFICSQINIEYENISENSEKIELIKSYYSQFTDETKAYYENVIDSIKENTKPHEKEIERLNKLKEERWGEIDRLQNISCFTISNYYIMVYILIFTITLCVWKKWRDKNPNNPPKLFWTLILGWIYLLYYYCNKKGI